VEQVKVCPPGMKVSTPSDSSHATDCRRGPATRRGKESRIRHTCPLPALDGYSLAPHSPPAKLAHYHNETETSGFVTSGEILLGQLILPCLPN
ncbi:hypothetical protein J6590_105180, partial [Homalodisca vitripennis]